MKKLASLVDADWPRCMCTSSMAVCAMTSVHAWISSSVDLLSRSIDLLKRSIDRIKRSTDLHTHARTDVIAHTAQLEVHMQRGPSASTRLASFFRGSDHL